MAIILEFEDYAQVHAEIQMINEGLWDDLVGKVKDFFLSKLDGKVRKEIDEGIAGADITNVLHKDGTLDTNILDEIASIKDTPSTKAAFKNIQGIVGPGVYVTQCLKLMEDGVVALMDEPAIAAAVGRAGTKNVADKGNKQAAEITGAADEQYRKRIADFSKTYAAAKANVEARVAEKMRELVGRAKSNAVKLLINNRYSFAKTAMLLIEYELKKTRLGDENVQNLKKEMVESYKLALQTTKALEQEVSRASKSANAFASIADLISSDINEFAQKYPAENTNAYSYSARVTPYLIIRKYDESKNMANVVYGVEVNDDDTYVEPGPDSAKWITLDELKEQLLMGANSGKNFDIEAYTKKYDFTKEDDRKAFEDASSGMRVPVAKKVKPVAAQKQKETAQDNKRTAQQNTQPVITGKPAQAPAKAQQTTKTTVGVKP